MKSVWGMNSHASLTMKDSSAEKYLYFIWEMEY